MEIEEISATRPSRSSARPSNPPWACANSRRAKSPSRLASRPLTQQMVRTLQGCYRAFRDLDATMVEINPLVITADNRILALDAKMTFDGNALFRTRRCPNCATSRRRPARKPCRRPGPGLYRPDGNIGCIVNGAGLAMATMDTIKLAGANRPTSWTSAAARRRNGWPRPSGW
jgi:succinyl-CoA synthetase beta subunit/malate-CoA ligase subunit beta